LERAPNYRAGFLAEACPDDKQLRLEVQTLLDRSASRNDLLARSARETAVHLLDSEMATRLIPGTQLGPYTVEAFLGARGMGQVYRARDSRLHRTVALVALNVLPLDQPGDPESQRHLLQEARASSALNHPNIIHL
jgi:serine/threonine protein kinase